MLCRQALVVPKANLHCTALIISLFMLNSMSTRGIYSLWYSYSCLLVSVVKTEILLVGFLQP